jgi:hypothetical protein
MTPPILWQRLRLIKSKIVCANRQKGGEMKTQLKTFPVNHYLDACLNDWLQNNNVLVLSTEIANNAMFIFYVSTE